MCVLVIGESATSSRPPSDKARFSSATHHAQISILSRGKGAELGAHVGGAEKRGAEGSRRGRFGGVSGEGADVGEVQKVNRFWEGHTVG